ncbi:MAG TPA: DUF1361 domain-containing protein [Herpetosiphonaceae bacterium]|nr:DUF1361 domain-containing protein [Herpetosiphonaceae bacterium]
MATLRSLHRFLLRCSFYPLILATALASALLLGRMRLSGTGTYGFLFWNITLAWIPYLASLALVATQRHAPRRWATALLGLIWFCFLPNAPYLITDLMHLRYNAEVPLIYDVGMLASAAWTGSFLAVASLRMVQALVRQAYGGLVSWLFVLLAIGSSGFGIYLGRVLRWNSWDVVMNPRAVLADVLPRAANPLAHPELPGITIIFAAIFLICYTFPSAGAANAADR